MYSVHFLHNCVHIMMAHRRILTAVLCTRLTTMSHHTHLSAHCSCTSHCIVLNVSRAFEQSNLTDHKKGKDVSELGMHREEQDMLVGVKKPKNMPETCQKQTEQFSGMCWVPQARFLCAPHHDDTSTHVDCSAFSSWLSRIITHWSTHTAVARHMASC